MSPAPNNALARSLVIPNRIAAQHAVVMRRRASRHSHEDSDTGTAISGISVAGNNNGCLGPSSTAVVWVASLGICILLTLRALADTHDDLM